MATSGAKPLYCELIRGEPLKLEDAHCNYPEYTSVVALSGDMLIVVDTEACQLRLHSCQNGHLLAISERLKAQPHDICLLESKGTQVAVTLLNGQIEILSVESTDKSAVLRQVWTSDAVVGKFKYCQGVRSLKLGNKLVVSGGTEDKEMQRDWICWGIVSHDNSDKFDVTVLKICESVGAGYGSSSYLATSSNDSTVYISCWTGPHYPENNGVYAFDVKEGRRKFMYHHHELNKPKGISVDRWGFIYVCNMRPPCIHQLTESREPVIIHKMPPQPLAMCWKENWEELYVTSMRSKEIWRLSPQWNEEVFSNKESGSTNEKQHLVLGEQIVSSAEGAVHLWAKENGINAGAVDELLKEGFTSIKAIKLLEPSDLVNTKIPRGQQKLIIASLKQLTEKDTVHVQSIQSDCMDISLMQRSLNGRESAATQQTVPLINLMTSTSQQPHKALSVGVEDPDATTRSDITRSDIPQCFNPDSASVLLHVGHVQSTVHSNMETLSWKDPQIYQQSEAAADLDTMYTGLVVLSQDKIIVVDNKASKVRLLSFQDGHLLAVYRLESKPRDICVCNNSHDNKIQMAVSLLTGQIEILSVKCSNQTTKITRMETLNVQPCFDGCCGVKYFSKKLVVSGWKKDNLCWGIVSITDGHIKKVHNICKGGKYSGSFLCTNNSDMVFISCYTENLEMIGVYGYRNSRPEFLYQHRYLNNPRGVTMDRRHVYVCNRYPPCIHEMTESGLPLTIHTQGIQLSSLFNAIHWNEQDGLLYVTNDKSNVITRFRPEYSDHHDPVIPAEVLKMDTRSLDMYKDALRGGKEKVYNIRIMVVGQYGVGKSTLTKRLLGKDVNISERQSTEGIDVHIECSKVSLSSGEWTAQEKNLEQDYRLQRLARVLTEKQSLRDRVDDGKEVVIYPQGDGTFASNAHISDEKKVMSPSQGGRTPDSYTNDVDKEQVKMDPVRDVLTSDSNADVADDVQRNITPNSNAHVADKDPMKEIIMLLQENADKLKQDTSRTSPLSVWDFAGQFAFYTTHQTFLTRRAIYLLVSDVSRQVTDLVDDECYFDSEGITKCRVHELNDVWLNSIHSCSPSTEAGVPPVILVGTHVDKIKQKQLPAKGIELETQTTSSETEEFTLPTKSTPATTEEHTRALSVLRSVKNVFTPRKTKRTVGTTSVSSITGAHHLPAEDPLKKQRKYKLWPGKKKKKVGTDVMAAPSYMNSVGEEMAESVGENNADAQEINHHKICERYFREIRTYLCDKPTRFHLVDEDFAIDNTVVDSRLEDLKRKIVEVASQQSYWGEVIPTRWLLLEQELMRLKAAGVKVITHSLLEDLNQAGAVPIVTEELDLFLRFEHDIGTVLYFSMEVLKDKIVLDPQWLIDALKSLITAEMFVLRSAPAIADMWLVFKRSGKLSPELIDAIWTKENNPDLHDNKEHILLLMEHLNIIAKPRCYSDDGSEIKVEKYFLAPCMLNETTPREVISPESQVDMKSSSVLCYIFIGRFLPPPIFHRLLASCVSHWPITKKKSENLIFCGCCVFDIDLFHRLTVFFKGYIIFARVTRIGTTEKTPSAKVCIEVREFITITLSNVIGYLGQSLKFELAIQCPKSEGYSVDSLIPIADLQENVGVPCHFHDESHVIMSHDVLKFWFQDEEHSDDGSAAGPLPSQATSDTDMFMRMAYLLVDVGSQVLRRLFHHHTVTPTCTLDQYLANNRNSIDKLYNWKTLNQSQMDIMFPPSGSTNLENFDITLLTSLLAHIVRPLSKKEKKLIKCLKEDRNEIYAHASSCKMNINEYQACWNSVTSTLMSLSQQCGDPNFENQILLEIQRIQVTTVPAGSYLNILRTWFNRIETVEDELQDLKLRFEAMEGSITITANING